MPPRAVVRSVQVDAKVIVDELLIDIGRHPPGLPPGRGDGQPPLWGPGWRPLLDNARLGMLLFLAAEAMFFAGLMSAFLGFRQGGSTWPPPGAPRLPIVANSASTVLLFLSGFTLHRAFSAVYRRGSPEAFRRPVSA